MPTTLQRTPSCNLVPVLIWGFPKIRGTFLGVLILRIIVFGGLYWGLISGMSIVRMGGRRVTIGGRDEAPKTSTATTSGVESEAA